MSAPTTEEENSTEKISQNGETKNTPIALPEPIEKVVTHIMTPGSSLNPMFLFLVDVSLAFLLLIFLSLLAMTWSLHFVALIGIEAGLWASVKLYVAELRKDNERIAQEKAEGRYKEE